MNEQNSLEQFQKPKNYLTIIIVILITALIVGGVVYAWQQSELKSTEANLQQQIASLQNQINQSAKNNSDQKTSELQKEAANKSSTENNASNPKDQDAQTPLQKIKEEGKHVYYSGKITVSGTYRELYGNSPSANTLCFYTDEAAGYLIPRSEDTRTPWFCFSNQSQAEEMLGIDEKAIMKNATIKCISGKATIEVSNYIVNKLEGEAWDTANLDKVISKETYKTSCSD